MIGAALFGVGWGISGLCPGPAIANLGIVPFSVALFIAAMLAGSWLAGALPELQQRPASPCRCNRIMIHSHDIIVVGAGPAGLAAALECHRRGFDVAIISPPRAGRDERTAALLAGSVDLLERLGAWDLLAAKSPMRSLRIVDATRRLIRAPEVTFHASEIGLAAFGYNVRNADLVDALEARVAARGIPRLVDQRCRRLC